MHLPLRQLRAVRRLQQGGHVWVPRSDCIRSGGGGRGAGLVQLLEQRGKELGSQARVGGALGRLGVGKVLCGGGGGGGGTSRQGQHEVV